MKGTLRDRPFAEIVGYIFQGKRTGELKVTATGKTITIHFQDGNPVAAASDDPGHRITRILLDNEKIGPGEAEMLGGLPESKQAFETVEYIPDETLLWGVKFRFLRLLEELFSWEEGDYDFSEGPVPPEALTLRVPTPFIVFTGTAKMPDSLFGAVSDEKIITEIREVPAAEEGFFNPQRKKFLASCKEGERVGDLLSSMPGDRERARHTLYALKALGLVVIADPPVAEPEPQLIVDLEPEPAVEPEPPPVVLPPQESPESEPLALFSDEEKEEETPAPLAEEEAPLSLETEEAPEEADFPLEPEEPAAAEPELVLDTEPDAAQAELELPMEPDAKLTPEDAPEMTLEPPPLAEGGGDQATVDEPAPPLEEKSGESAGDFKLPDTDFSPPEVEEGASLSSSLGLGLEKESVETPPPVEEEEPRRKKSRLARPSLRAGKVAAIGGVLLLVVAGSLVGLKFFGGEEPPPPSAPPPPPAALPSAPPPAAEAPGQSADLPAAEPAGENVVETALPAGSAGEDPPAPDSGSPQPLEAQEAVPPAQDESRSSETAAVAAPDAAAPPAAPPTMPVDVPAEEPAAAMPADADASLAAGDIGAAARAWAEELRGSPEGTYTLQILMVCEAKSVEESYPALAAHGKVYVVPFSLKGRSCYRFGLGAYPSLENAKAALAGLPEGIRKGGAVVKSLKTFLPEGALPSAEAARAEGPAPLAPAPPAEAAPPSKEPAAEWERGMELFESGDLPAAAGHWRQMIEGATPGNYTLQILTACDAGTVGNYFSLFKEHGRVFAVPLSLKGKPCYRVGLETYPSKKAAKAALAAMPQWVRDQRTVVKNVSLLVR